MKLFHIYQPKNKKPVPFGHTQPLKDHPSGWIVIKGTPTEEQGKQIDIAS